MRIVVLGLGNVLLSDEGIGVQLIEYLKDNLSFPPDIELIDGGVGGLSLLGLLAGATHLLVIDAVEAGARPGTIIRLVNSEVIGGMSLSLSSHQIGLRDILGAAELAGILPQEIVLLGVQPYSLEPGRGLSEPARSILPQLQDKVLEQLRFWGVDV